MFSHNRNSIHRRPFEGERKIVCILALSSITSMSNKPLHSLICQRRWSIRIWFQHLLWSSDNDFFFSSIDHHHQWQQHCRCLSLSRPIRPRCVVALSLTSLLHVGEEIIEKFFAFRFVGQFIELEDERSDFNCPCLSGVVYASKRSSSERCAPLTRSR